MGVRMESVDELEIQVLLDQTVQLASLDLTELQEKLA